VDINNLRTQVLTADCQFFFFGNNFTGRELSPGYGMFALPVSVGK
jgi:hypothetical protein